MPQYHAPLLTVVFTSIHNTQVVHACALEYDMQTLQKGDATMAGERGMNLSGGQRQRVGLARAAYHESQVVLLDNPLRCLLSLCVCLCVQSVCSCVKYVCVVYVWA